jgi:hypothetical protein
MEIDYELIIKYLVKKNSNGKSINKSNDFITHKNIYNYSINFPDKFKEILTDKFYRYGITTNDNENNNMSFWSSILTLIDTNFIIPYSSDELELITQFKRQLIEKYNKSKLSSFIKDLDKNDLKERFKLDQDIYTLQYLVDIMDINILIFDWETMNIHCVYHKEIMNPLKKTILLAKFKNQWEPIMMIKIKGETERLFDFNNSTIKKMLTTHNLISYFDGEMVNKHFILNEDIYSIAQQEKIKLKVKEPPSKEVINNDSDSDSSVKTNSDENDVFITEDELEKLRKLSKIKLNKMKLCELFKLVNKLKIIITIENPTKSILITTILAKLKPFS